MDTLKSQSKPEVHGFAFSPDEAKTLQRNATEARVIFRMIALAIDAENDGSTDFDDGGGAERWGAAVGEVRTRLREIRDIAIEAVGGCGVDWVPPLNLVEALDASLWYGHSCDEGERLSSREIACAVQIIARALDTLARECDAMGAAKLTGDTDTPAVH